MCVAPTTDAEHCPQHCLLCAPLLGRLSIRLLRPQPQVYFFHSPFFPPLNCPPMPLAHLTPAAQTKAGASVLLPPVRCIIEACPSPALYLVLRTCPVWRRASIASRPHAYRPLFRPHFHTFCFSKPLPSFPFPSSFFEHRPRAVLVPQHRTTVLSEHSQEVNTWSHTTESQTTELQRRKELEKAVVWRGRLLGRWVAGEGGGSEAATVRPPDGNRGASWRSGCGHGVLLQCGCSVAATAV